ncbi:MAG TPA: glycosyltransferase family 1 protein [Terriglobales bacterium]|jgi:glycosyltransferase involved in cell wall biosynthesis|nr:glycosyltransferase family 1 protein [Terriglobales bacterium]
MKIGIDAHALGSQSAGNESYYLQLLRALACSPSNGNRYIIYFTHADGEKQIPLSDQFFVKRIWPANPYFRIPFAFPVECRREKLDVFHAQYIVPPFCGSRSVTTIADILFEGYPELYNPVERVKFGILFPWSARRSDHIITVSQFSKNDIVTRYHVDPERVTVVYEAPRQEFQRMDVHHCREMLARKYDIRVPFILYVGRINVRKNLERLVEAVAMLSGKGFAHELVIVGKQDWMAGRVMQKVRNLSLESKVRFVGYVPADDLPVFYNGADLFVYPSICEGFGIPLVEAMACGVPVVTSFGSSLEEVAADAAVLADPYSVASIANGMEKVLSDDVFARELTEKGLHRASQFTEARKAEETIGVYHRVCA